LRLASGWRRSKKNAATKTMPQQNEAAKRMPQRKQCRKEMNAAKKNAAKK
jgi:hypothetical protein